MACQAHRDPLDSQVEKDCLDLREILVFQEVQVALDVPA